MHADQLSRHWSSPLDTAHGQAVNPNMHVAWYNSLKGTIKQEGIEEQCVGYKHCCGIFTTLYKCKAHCSRVRSTLVPSVACQTTEGKYHSY